MDLYPLSLFELLHWRAVFRFFQNYEVKMSLDWQEGWIFDIQSVNIDINHVYSKSINHVYPRGDSF